MAGLRVGIVCEGPTDSVVMKTIGERFLNENGWQAHFFPIQPTRDNTQGEQGGWTMVRDWIRGNPQEVRAGRYFGAGLFANNLDALRCDAIMIHLDSDIVSDPAFNEGILPARRSPEGDFQYTINKLESWLNVEDMTKADRSRYVLCVAVQSSETWCLALFHRTQVGIEQRSGEDLGLAFNRALLASESNPNAPVGSNPIKDRVRRKLFVEKQATSVGIRQAMEQSQSLKKTLMSLIASAESIAQLPSN